MSRESEQWVWTSQGLVLQDDDAEGWSAGLLSRLSRAAQPDDTREAE
jgi:hypothetical protein